MDIRKEIVGSVLVVALVAAFAPAPARAQLGFEVRGQMGLGGDEIATVEYSDGSDSDLALGTYFAATIGPVLELWSGAGSAIELQAMAGWAGWSTGPADTDDRLSLNRFPFDALVHYGYRFPGRDMSLRIGGGYSYHLVGDMGGSGSLEGVEVGVESSGGPVGEASLVLGILNVGVRYTQMDNAVEGVPDPLSGASLGIFLGITHPRN